MSEQRFGRLPPLSRIAQQKQGSKDDFPVDEFERALLLEHKGERQAALAICSEIYTKRQDAIGSLDISRALTGCTTLWVATSDVAKVMDVQRVLFPFMTNGEEPAAQLAWRALQNGDKTEARKFAWKVRSHRRREALLSAITRLE